MSTHTTAAALASEPPTAGHSPAGGGADPSVDRQPEAAVERSGAVLEQGYTVPTEALSWSPDDWREHLEDSPYCATVLEQADENLHLPLRVARLVLRQHRWSFTDYGADIQRGAAQGCTVLPLAHAGQLLTWLGY